VSHDLLGVLAIGGWCTWCIGAMAFLRRTVGQ